MFLLFLRRVSAVAFAAALVESSFAAPLSIEDLFRPPQVSQAKLSPDGEHYAAIVSDEKDVRHLVVFNVADQQATGLKGGTLLEPSGVKWLNNQRLIFSVSEEKLYSYGLYTVGLDAIEDFSPLNLYDATEIIGMPRSRPSRLLVWIVQDATDEGRPGDLVELDTSRAGRWAKSTEATVVRSYDPPKDGQVVGWQADYNGELALCYTYQKGQASLHQRIDGKRWQRTSLDISTVSPMELDPDGTSLWTISHDEAKGYQLRQYNLASGEFGQPVFSDAHYDPSEGAIYFSPQAKKIAGISYSQRRLNHAWFVDSFAKAQATMDHNHPDTDNILIGFDERERRFLFFSDSPRNPGFYSLLDLEAKRLQVLFDVAPQLKNQALRPTQPISFATRDKVQLEGYLTLPEAAPPKHLPLVVLVHGGPWARDTWGYDPEVQFLASRGYAVLQPNYRGSTGYSPEISLEKKSDFRLMHDDVTDATRAMIRSGIADPDRIAIMGGSFGGYLALAGATFEDKLYRCAVSLCGVFDWEQFIKGKRAVSRPGEYEWLVDHLGAPGSDRTRFEQISPLAHIDQLHVPVFVAHGTEDSVVDVKQSKKLVSQLKKRGIPYETFYRDLEGHGFFSFKDRVDYYHAVEAFLAKNMVARNPTPAK